MSGVLPVAEALRAGLGHVLRDGGAMTDGELRRAIGRIDGGYYTTCQDADGALWQVGVTVFGPSLYLARRAGPWADGAPALRGPALLAAVRAAFAVDRVADRVPDRVAEVPPPAPAPPPPPPPVPAGPPVQLGFLL